MTTKVLMVIALVSFLTFVLVSDAYIKNNPSNLHMLIKRSPINGGSETSSKTGYAIVISTKQYRLVKLLIQNLTTRGRCFITTCRVNS